MTEPQSVWLQHYHPDTPHTLAECPDGGLATLPALFKRATTRFGDRPALWWRGQTTTWSEFGAQVEAAAAGLRARGLRRGDKVAIILPNCPEFLISLFAVQRLGAVAVPHNPRFTAAELGRLFADHGARFAVVSAAATPTVAEALAQSLADAASLTPRTIVTVPDGSGFANYSDNDTETWLDWADLVQGGIGKLKDSDDGANAGNTAQPDDLALILYTSGTTGQPRAVGLTHANLVANARQTRAFLPNVDAAGIRGGERFLAALPLFHSYGFMFNVMVATLVGAQIVLVPAPTMPVLLETISQVTPTLFAAVPTLYRGLLDAAAREGVSLRGIARGISGAATLPVELVAAWEEATGGVLVEGYGLTEASPILTINPLTTARRAGSIGVALPDTELKVVDPQDPAREMPAGEPGELLARGPQVFGGYLGQADATERAFHDGWLRTGDMAVMESDGFVRLVGRLKEVINTGGFNVYPAEVEQVLRRHPDVADAAVVGLPRLRGRADGSEDVVAAVVLRPGAALDEVGVRDFARRELTGYKVPRRVVAVDALPADGLGKVRRKDVRALLESLGIS